MRKIFSLLACLSLAVVTVGCDQTQKAQEKKAVDKAATDANKDVKADAKDQKKMVDENASATKDAIDEGTKAVVDENKAKAEQEKAEIDAEPDVK